MKWKKKRNEKSVFVYIFYCGERGCGAVRRCRRHLANGFRAAVAGGEYAWRQRGAALVGHDVSVPIERRDVRKRLVFGHLTDGDENAVDRQVAAVARFGVFVFDGAERTVFYRKLGDSGIIYYRNVLL